MAVRLEGAHTQFFGQGEGLAVEGCGLIAFWRLAPRRNVTEEVQGIRLVATFLRLDRCSRLVRAGGAP